MVSHVRGWAAGLLRRAGQRAKQRASQKARAVVQSAGAKAGATAARPVVRFRDWWNSRVAKAGHTVTRAGRWVQGATKWLVGGLVVGTVGASVLREWVIIPCLLRPRIMP